MYGNRLFWQWIHLTAAPGWCAIRSGDLNLTAVGWWLGRYCRWRGAAGWWRTAVVGSTGMDGVLSELRWCGCYNNNYYLVLVGCGCMVWWGVSAVSGSSERYEIPCSLMKSHDMKSNVASGGSNERMLSDIKRQIPRITARESQESSIQNYTKIWKQFVTRMGFEPMTLTLKV